MVSCRTIMKYRVLYVVTTVGLLLWLILTCISGKLTSRLVHANGSRVAIWKCDRSKRPLSMYTHQVVSDEFGNQLSGYSQVTYLCNHCHPVCNSDFPYVHMPSPKLDLRITYSNQLHSRKLAPLVDLMLKEHPNWKDKSYRAIQKEVDDGRRNTFSKGVLYGVDQLSKYSKLSHTEVKLKSIPNYLALLQTRIFPDKPRAMSCDRCFVYGFKTIIAPQKLCTNGEKVELVAIVTTVPMNFKARELARRTWASKYFRTRYHFKVLFLFGVGWPSDQIEILQKEHQQYNDILMDDFIDNYFNLTQKVLMGFRWVLRKCPQARFVMRGADDTKVSMPAIFKLLHQFGRTEPFQKHQVGTCYTSYNVYRGATFKGYVNTLEYDKDRFPPYALGTIFFTSIALTRKLVTNSPDLPYFPIEDAYFGMLLARLGIGCHHVEGLDSIVRHQNL